MDNRTPYRPRIADALLAERLSHAGAVVIRGAKWCGKTRTAEQQAQSALFLQDPDARESNLEMARTKPSLLLRGEQPRLIDEWQDAPQLWDAVRFSIDRSGGFGHYILTGSATPRSDRRPAHSGTGRFSFLTMRPMSLFESGESSAEVSLAALFKQPEDIVGIALGDVEDISLQVFRGGWPEAVARGEGASTTIPADYLEAVAEEDISAIDGVQRSPSDAKLIMRAYARACATMAQAKAIRLSITQRQDPIAKSTFDSYVSALRRLYVFEDLEAWRPSLRDKTRVSATPTRHFVDPSLAAAAMGATPEMLLRDTPTLGLLFESLVVRDLRAYASAMRAEVFHYHDVSGLEADAVVVAPSGAWGALEVKLSPSAAGEGAKSLLRLARRVDHDAVGSLAFLAVVTSGGYAYRRDDGVYVVPVSCLAP